MTQTPVILCLNRAGEPLAHRLAGRLELPVHGRKGRVARADLFFANALDHARDLFAAGTPVIGVCAAGILIRAVAPLLNDKRAEPPLIAVPDDGSVVVPLLGGHRGANRLAREVATALGATAAVTTAGDVALGVALDEPPPGWRLANPGNARQAMAALLAGGRAHVGGDAAALADWLAPLNTAKPDTDGPVVDLICTARPHEVAPPALLFHPQRFTLGVGCARHCPPAELIGLAERVLAEAGIAPGALAALATIDLKADEPAMLALAQHLDVPLRLFSAAELDAETPRTETPSEVVLAEVGTHGVAENASLAAAGPDARLALPKRKTAMATAALALAPRPIAAPGGRPRGLLALVGIGPGQAAWRTPEASRLIAEADELVGYSLYLDLLGPLAFGKPRRDFPLGAEEDRCRHALEAAGAGRRVALVCSGDAGIYAMGALVHELLDRDDTLSDAARRVQVVTAPGITAMQAAAARSGALLGHDFCAISLSDLLTPRADILRRIQAAAEGDFVVAFYNPVSKTRRTLLAEARDILLNHRPADTPVVLATDLGRPAERLRHLALADLTVDAVDMLTVVLVGSSQSRRVDTGDGPRAYTPRGYAAGGRDGSA